MEFKNEACKGMKKRWWILRTCDRNMSSRGGFKYPKKGWIEAPDWDPKPVCGGGLHGLLNGQGNHMLLDFNGLGMLCYTEEEPIDLGGKVKCRRIHVSKVGDLSDICQLLMQKTGVRTGVPFSTASTSGKWSTASTSGRKSTASTSGDESTASTSGDESTASTSGYESTASTSGEWSTASTSGDESTASSSGDKSTASTSGDESTASSSGYKSIASSSGYGSTASTSGFKSKASALGDRSAAIANGEGGRVMAEKDGCALLTRHEDVWCYGVTGQDGIKAGVWYTGSKDGRLVQDASMAGGL